MVNAAVLESRSSASSFAEGQLAVDHDNEERCAKKAKDKLNENEHWTSYQGTPLPSEPTARTKGETAIRTAVLR